MMRNPDGTWPTAVKVIAVLLILGLVGLLLLTML
jgi:hypothetical protein